MRIIPTFLIGATLLFLPFDAKAAERSVLSKTTVQNVQETLADGGFYRAGIDGLWGPATVQGLRSFQFANGLEMTGHLDKSTVSELGVKPVYIKVPVMETADTKATILSAIMPASGDAKMPAQPKKAMTTYYDPSEVQAAQQALREAGYYRKANVDGIIGIHTINALRSFQNDNGLRITGKLDNPTRMQLGLRVQEADIISRAN